MNETLQSVVVAVIVVAAVAWSVRRLLKPKRGCCCCDAEQPDGKCDGKCGCGENCPMKKSSET